MKYSKNAVYTRIRNAVKAAHGAGIYVTGVIAAVPTKSPTVMCLEVSKVHNAEAVSLSGLQPVWTSTFETQVFSNKEKTGLSECYSIMDTVTSEFVKLGYVLIMQDLVENGTDANKYRLTSRYRRVIGANDDMPSQ